MPGGGELVPLCLGPLPHLHWPLWPISQPWHPPWMLLYSHWCPIWESETPPRMVMSSWKTPQQCLRHRWHMLLQRYLRHCQHSAFSITGIHYCNGASGIVSECGCNGASGIVSIPYPNSALGIVSICYHNSTPGIVSKRFHNGASGIISECLRHHQQTCQHLWMLMQTTHLPLL